MTIDSKLDALRRGSRTVPVQPIKEMPKLAKMLASKYPKAAEELEALDRQLDEWRKTLGDFVSRVITPITTTQTSVPITSVVAAAPISVKIGTVSIGDVAMVTNSGTATEVVLNFVFPRGEAGSPGEPTRFLCPDNGRYYFPTPRTTDDPTAIATEWRPV